MSQKSKHDFGVPSHVWIFETGSGTDFWTKKCLLIASPDAQSTREPPEIPGQIPLPLRIAGLQDGRAAPRPRGPKPSKREAALLEAEHEAAHTRRTGSPRGRPPAYQEPEMDFSLAVSP